MAGHFFLRLFDPLSAALPACGKTDHWQLRQMSLRRVDGRPAGKENTQRGRWINILTNATLYQIQVHRICQPAHEEVSWWWILLRCTAQGHPLPPHELYKKNRCFSPGCGWTLSTSCCNGAKSTSAKLVGDRGHWWREANGGMGMRGGPMWLRAVPCE